MLYLQRLLGVNLSFTEDHSLAKIVIESESHLNTRALQDCTFCGSSGGMFPNGISFLTLIGLTYVGTRVLFLTKLSPLSSCYPTALLFHHQIQEA